jgi:3-methyladenine DNA glycosylase AlkC
MVRTDTARMEETLKQVRKSIQHALKDINRPSMSVEELRARVDEEMGDMRLSDFIVRQRDDRG